MFRDFLILRRNVHLTRTTVFIKVYFGSRPLCQHAMIASPNCRISRQFSKQNMYKLEINVSSIVILLSLASSSLSSYTSFMHDTVKLVLP